MKLLANKILPLKEILYYNNKNAQNNQNIILR
jgi:hypothetical protein